MRKFIAFISLLSLLIASNLGFLQVYAVETNNSAQPWTIQKARHLAKKALFGATEQQIDLLFNVGSAQNAVNVLFPTRNGPGRTSFDTRLSTLMNDPGFNPASSGDMYEYYLTKKAFDPYEAKAKFFLIFEDTFSVNNSSSRDITFLDIENTHNLLYSHTLGNYKEMVKRSMYNNGNPGDYSVSKFLDLLNQKDPERPNENYARELLQLLLMLEYIPTESEDSGAERNYSETDVNRLAKILVGYEYNENTHQVTFNNSVNTNQTVEFLQGPLKNGDSFAFYNPDENQIDIETLKLPTNGNNGLSDNIIDYIFSKREREISLFLADKMYRFYVAENPTINELNLISNEIIRNDFDLYTSVKWLLANDLMYTDKSMNTIIYKNPVELVVGTAKILETDNVEPIKYSLGNLNWRPYYPGSIFGRIGFDRNPDFFNTSTSIKWANEASRIVNYSNINHMIDTNLTMQEFIQDLEIQIYGEERLPQVVKDKFTTFLTTDENQNAVSFDLSSTDYINKYVKSLIYFMLIQPEYVIQSGHDTAQESQDEVQSFYENDNKLIVIKYRGGLDWLHAIVEKDEYTQYNENRGNGALARDEFLSLDQNYYINENLSDFKSLFDSGDLKVFNRVGTPQHSRGHDSASRKMASVYNEYATNGDGIIGHFIKNENPLKTVVLGSDKSLVYRGGQYLNVGTDVLYRITDNTNNDFRIHKIATQKDILNSRNYPSDLGFIFQNGVYLSNVGEASVANGGRSGAGYNMQDNLAFAENLFDSGITNVVRLAADGGYDTHGRQRNSLDNNLKRVAERTANFYNRVKDKHNVTIVLYSEFGRTLKINESEGTDHGKGGGMFILSNNNQWKQALPEKVYGNNSFINAQANRLGVGIDYRSVYKQIFQSLYNKDISETLGGAYNIETYLDGEKPETELFRIELVRDGSRTRGKILFNVDDINYFHTQGSHLQFSYGSDPNNMRVENRYTIDRYMVKGDKQVELYMRSLSSDTQYHYVINLYDNQYNKTEITGTFTTPVINNRDNKKLNKKSSTRFSRLEGLNIDGTRNLSEEEQIILSEENSENYMGENNISLSTGTGTVVDTIETSTGTTWDGTFYLPKDIQVERFIGKKSKFGEKSLENFNIDKIVKVGADSLSLSLKLNKPVNIDVPGINRNKNYTILYSNDGEQWNKLENANIRKNGNNISFQTDHFTYFAITQSDNSGNPIDNSNDNNSNNNSGRSSGGGGGGGGAKKRDNCKYGDYSPSYYDKSCGKTADAKEVYKLANLKTRTKNISINIENDVINNALEELQQFEGNKYQIFHDLFENVNASSKDQEAVLKLLRQEISTVKVNGYDIYYIKKGTKNDVFKKIANVFTRQNFSKDYTVNIVESINDLILSYAIMTSQDVSTQTKNKAKNSLSNSLTSLKYYYKLAVENKKRKKVVFQQSTVEQNKAETTRKTKQYYKDRKAAILRKHKQK